MCRSALPRSCAEQDQPGGGPVRGAVALVVPIGQWMTMARSTRPSAPPAGYVSSWGSRSGAIPDTADRQAPAGTRFFRTRRAPASGTPTRLRGIRRHHRSAPPRTKCSGPTRLSATTGSSCGTATGFGRTSGIVAFRYVGSDRTGRPRTTSAPQPCRGWSPSRPHRCHGAKRSLFRPSRRHSVHMPQATRW